MKAQRPVNLNLATLKFPPMAITSILHRISGVLLFVLMPLIFYLFSLSLKSAEDFTAISNCIYAKLILWAFFSAFGYHLLAGLKHLIADLGHHEGLVAARRSAYALLIITFIITIYLGYIILC